MEEMLLGLVLAWAALAAMVLLALAKKAASGLSACCTFAVACLKGVLVSRGGPDMVASEARAAAGVAGTDLVADIVGVAALMSLEADTAGVVSLEEGGDSDSL